MIEDLRRARIARLDTTDDIDTFKRWLSEDRNRYSLHFDTETGGVDGAALQWYRPGFKVRLVQFGDADKGFVMRADRFGALIEEVFTTYEGDFSSHNGIGFDGHALTAAGFSLPPKHRWHDTLMQSRLIDPRGKHGLKEIGTKHFGAVAASAQRALDEAFKIWGFGKDKGRGFSEIPFGVKAYDVYSGVDVILGARLDEIQRPVVLRDFREAYERELGAWWVVFEHEAKGLPIDREAALKLRDEYLYKIQILRGQLREMGIEHPTRKAEKLEALYKEGWEPDDFTETGEPKLDKKILELITSPVAGAIIEYGRLEGWLTKYIDKVIDDSYNGYVYPSFNPFGALTGRQAAYGPPVQQLPGRHPDAYQIRALFTARHGEQLWSIDYDGEENRLGAHFSGDEALTKLILSGAKIHRYTASIIYNKPESEVTHEEYNIVKGVVYADQYGGGVKKLSKMLNMSEDEVRAIKRGIAEAYPGMAAWKKQVEREAKQRYLTEGDAYAYTWGGRRVYADQFEEMEPKYYTLANYVLQGTGADVLKEALNRIAAAELSQYIYLPIHDELLFSLPPGPEGEEIAHELARLMTFKDEFSIPLTCSPEFLGDHWKPHE